MDKRQIKAFSEAYDKIYDLVSATNYESFKDFDTILEKELIDKIFICLTGYSLNTILFKSEEIII